MNPFNRMHRSPGFIYGTIWTGEACELEAFVVKKTSRDMEPVETTADDARDRL